MIIIILITLIIIVLSSENTGLRIDLNVEIPLLENQYVIFNATQQQEGASSQILPTHKLLVNLKNNSLGIYSQMFDFLQYTNQSQINCYQQNVVVLTDVFGCTQSCNSTPDTSNLGIRNISYVQTDEKDEQLQYLVIDNSQLPCVNGTFFKLIVPWITVQALFKFQDSSYLIGTISKYYCFISYNYYYLNHVNLKYYIINQGNIRKKQEDHKKKILLRNLIMRSDYQEQTEDQSIYLQEIKQSQVSNYYKN